MTFENRTLIEIADMQAIEFECLHCHARHSVNLARVDRQITHCPNCNQQWFSDENKVSTRPSPLRILMQFIKVLNEMKETEFGATVRLQIVEHSASKQ